MKSEKLLGWHFLANNGTSFGGYLPTELEQMDGEPIPCERGFHASRRVLDALDFAKGSILRRVELSGKIIESETDVACATRRREIWRIDAKPILREFVRWCALQSVNKRWNEAPAVVIEYLTTGDESIRDASLEAARSAEISSNADWIKSRGFRHSDESLLYIRNAARSVEYASASDLKIIPVINKVFWVAYWAAASPDEREEQNRKLTDMIMKEHERQMKAEKETADEK